jgi:glutathione S-transferase
LSDRLILHEQMESGNCYKIRLTAALLEMPIELREYDITKGETRTPEFMRTVNANGRIPTLQVGDRFITESNAACYYLAEGTPLIPEDRFDHADMLRWMFWEQYSHEPNIATLRFWLCWVGIEKLTDVQRLLIPLKRDAGNAALKLMDEHLNGREWLVGNHLTLADVCLFAYTHVADAGGFELGRYRNVTAWIERVRAQPNFLAIEG